MIVCFRSKAEMAIVTGEWHEAQVFTQLNNEPKRKRHFIYKYIVSTKHSIRKIYIGRVFCFKDILLLTMSIFIDPSGIAVNNHNCTTIFCFTKNRISCHYELAARNRVHPKGAMARDCAGAHTKKMWVI